MEQHLEPFKIQNWYTRLSLYTLPAVFVYLSENEIDSLANGDSQSKNRNDIVSRLQIAMQKFSLTRFVGTDFVAPTDTNRFEDKHGAVCSAESAWNILCSSAKVRNAAQNHEVSLISVKPFRRMNPDREFRLFIKDGKLRAMSQYWLTKYLPAITKKKDFYWELAEKFVNRIFWVLPYKDIVLDIYFTSKDEILVIDLNPFGEPTDPLMLNSWNYDWNSEKGIKLIPSPTSVSGDINVSF